MASDNTVFPVRAGLQRLVNYGVDFEKFTHEIVVNKTEKADFNKLMKKKANKAEKEDCDFMFVVPRNDDILVLGTFIELEE